MNKNYNYCYGEGLHFRCELKGRGWPIKWLDFQLNVRLLAKFWFWGLANLTSAKISFNSSWRFWLVINNIYCSIAWIDKVKGFCSVIVARSFGFQHVVYFGFHYVYYAHAVSCLETNYKFKFKEQLLNILHIIYLKLQNVWGSCRNKQRKLSDITVLLQYSYSKSIGTEGNGSICNVPE